MLSGELRSVPAGDAATEGVFGPASFVTQMARFEIELAAAGADAGVVPGPVADRIRAAVGDGSWLQADHILAASSRTGSPVIALLTAVRSRLDPDDAAYVHLGATTQDAVDTALVLQIRAALDVLDVDLARIATAAAHLAAEHRDTPMIGRTLLRHAVPISFGLRAARWLALTSRARERLREVRGRLAIQLGGAAGTLLPLGDRAAAVETALAERLALEVPELPWHAERDRLGHIVATVGVVTGGLSKLASDLLALSQEELGEVSFTTGGGSSAMPHKQNPVDAMYAVTAARLSAGSVSAYLHAMGQEHERAAGGWQAEWVLVADVFRAAGGCAHRTAVAIEAVAVHPDRMAANLDATGGVLTEALTSGLAAHVGPAEAQRLTDRVIRQAAAVGRPLAEVAADDQRVVEVLGDDLANLDPARQLGSAGRLVDRALATASDLGTGGPATGR